jgi:hypothetical protein
LCIANEWLEDSVGISDQESVHISSKTKVDFDIPSESFEKGKEPAGKRKNPLILLFPSDAH